MSVTLSLSYILEHQKLEIIANTLGAKIIGLNDVVKRSPPEGVSLTYREWFDDEGRVYFRETLDSVAVFNFFKKRDLPSGEWRP